MTEERLKLFEKEETRINAIIDTLSQDKGGLAEKLKQEDIKDFLISLWVDCATENGIQWHDLRKDPNDLPKAQPLNWVLAVYDNGILWCRARREKCVDGVYWVNSFHNVIHDVVMWAKVEIPQFKE